MSQDINLATYPPGHRYQPLDEREGCDIEAGDALDLGGAGPKARTSQRRSALDVLLWCIGGFIGVLVIFAALRLVSLSSDEEEHHRDESLAAALLNNKTKTSNGTFLIHFRSQKHLNENEPPNCPIPIAYTNNEEEADAVVWAADGFHGLLQEERDDLRASRPNQSQVIWASEAAPNRGALERYFDSLKFNASFPLYDADMTYRLNGSVPGTYAYGYMNFSNPPIPYASKRQDRIAAAFITNCHPRNARTLLLEELMNLLPGQIDSFGPCKNNAKAEEILEELGHLEDAGESASRWNMKITTINYYKFTIAFENSNDLDYVTEKFYQPLERGSIPIVFGAPNYTTRFFPSIIPPAAIDIGQYLSENLTQLSTTQTEAPEELSPEDKEGVARLAARLSFLSSEEGRSEYDSMLAWKRDDKWKTESPLGKIVALGQGEARDCKLAGTLKGLEWAQSNWTETVIR